jgi:hypothetical protein
MAHPEEFDSWIADARQRVRKEKELAHRQDERNVAEAQRIARIRSFGGYVARLLVAANVQPTQIKVLKYYFWGARKSLVGAGWEVPSSLPQDPDNVRLRFQTSTGRC